MSDAHDFLKAARNRLRHQAHVYANTKFRDDVHKDEVAKDLEEAAQVLTLAAAQVGLQSNAK